MTVEGVVGPGRIHLPLGSLIPQYVQGWFVRTSSPAWHAYFPCQTRRAGDIWRTFKAQVTWRGLVALRPAQRCQRGNVHLAAVLQQLAAHEECARRHPPAAVHLQTHKALAGSQLRRP